MGGGARGTRPSGTRKFLLLCLELGRRATGRRDDGDGDSAKESSAAGAGRVFHKSISPSKQNRLAPPVNLYVMPVETH